MLGLDGDGTVIGTELENCDVLLPASVAVAVMKTPGRAGRATLKLDWPVTVMRPRNVFPSAEASGLAKNSRV